MADNQDLKLNYIRTALTYFSFLGIGSGMTVLGSSVLDLQIQVQENYEKVAHVIPIRAAGLIFGYFFAGLIGERLNPQILMFLTNLFSAITFASAPWNHHLVGLFIDFFCSGLFLAATKVCCNQFIFTIWGDKSPLYLQFLYMAYDIGSFAAPFWTKPFLLPDQIERVSIFNSTLNETQEISVAKVYHPNDVKVMYPIMLVGAVFFISSMGFLILHYTRPFVKPLPMSTIKKVDSHITNYGEKTWLKWVIIVLMCFFTHAAQSTTDLVGEMGPSFAVFSDLHLPKQTGVTLVSVFWGAFTSYRIIFVFLLRYTTADRAKMINVVLILIAIIVLVPHGEYEPTTLWAGIVLLGLGMCPLFAATYGQLSSYFPVTSRMTAAFFISTCIGRLIYPWIVSQYLSKNATVFLYVLAYLVVTSGILTIIIPCIGMKYMEYANEAKIKQQQLQLQKQQARSISMIVETNVDSGTGKKY